MTESQWLKSRDPGTMLEHLQPDEGGRKVRLFKCACCYLMWPLLWDEHSRKAVQLAERYADGEVTAATLRRAGRAAEEVWYAARDRRLRYQGRNLGPLVVRTNVAEMAFSTTAPAGYICVSVAGVARGIFHPTEEGVKPDATFPPSPLPMSAPGRTTEQLRRWLARLVRDVFGNPFRPVALSSQWRTETALSIARQMYESRDFAAMPILGDALEETGCIDEEILGHCRGPGPHVRGCWVVDLLLGKE